MYLRIFIYNIYRENDKTQGDRDWSDVSINQRMCKDC